MWTPRGLGYKPDPPKLPGQTPDRDARDKLRAVPIPFERRLFDLTKIADQSIWGACVAFAVNQTIRGSLVHQGIVDPEFPSFMWTWHLARAAHNEQYENAGTFIRFGFSGLTTLGYPRESDWPYSTAPGAFAEAPPPGVSTAAYDQRAPTEYHRIFETGADRVLAVKRALAQGYLIAFGTQVSDRFCADDLGSGPVDPPVGLPIAGGHAMCICGYRGDEFDVANSWGTGWGDGGYWTMSADYLAWGETQDLWICQAAPPFSGGK